MVNFYKVLVTIKICNITVKMIIFGMYLKEKKINFKREYTVCKEKEPKFNQKIRSFVSFHFIFLNFTHTYIDIFKEKIFAFLFFLLIFLLLTNINKKISF